MNLAPQDKTVKTEFVCHQCGQHKSFLSDITTGYGIDKDGNKVCYECCAKNDAKELIELQPGKKTIQYWDGRNITNWPGSLKISPYHTSKGRHNIAGTRTDIYFKFEGFSFHATQYGDMTQIAHIRKLKN